MKKTLFILALSIFSVSAQGQNIFVEPFYTVWAPNFFEDLNSAFRGSSMDEVELAHLQKIKCQNASQETGVRCRLIPCEDNERARTSLDIMGFNTIAVSLLEQGSKWCNVYFSEKK